MILKNYKKAFTLAEVLIVLMVIGVIAALTVPALINGIQDAQYKTAYKKAYNTIYSIVNIEKMSGNLPLRSTANLNVLMQNLKDFENVLIKNLTVQDFAIANSGDFDSNTTFSNTPPEKGTFSINTQDGISYIVQTTSCRSAGTCTKANINLAQNAQDAAKSAVFVIYVDVNGISKGPNAEEDQTLEDNKRMKSFVNDWFPIYVGSDGIAPGNRLKTVTGRIMSEIK